MQNLKEKQDKEFDEVMDKCFNIIPDGVIDIKEFLDKVRKESYDAGRGSVIVDSNGFIQQTMISKTAFDLVRRETAREEREKIKQNIGLLRQYLNERTDTNLITNKELETFLIKEL